MRLRESWHRPGQASAKAAHRVAEKLLETLDPFDRVQLCYVATVCMRSKTLSDAGHEIFCVSRGKRSVTNDPGRLKKYLTKFGLHFEDVCGKAVAG